ncbi:branched-chain amino acid ABC transporter permease [Achromobacter sp. GG226]|nr:branched-chain amino acid ABC transporter permease [Verticiella sp. GG226]MBU4609430.1 branched-chain amino acid ABC transporter permease [Verticiella sp. GG226]
MRLAPWVVLAALAAIPLVAPVFGLDYYIEFVRRVLIVTIAAASLNVILGYGGMVALGHAGFIGVGAYTVVALVDAGFDQVWLAWPLAMLAAAGFALVIGAISLRTRGVYFIMITLAFAQMLYYVAVSLSTYGGDDGYGIYSPLSLGWFDGRHPHMLYWIVLALAATAFLLVGRLAGSRFGKALQGIRDNETRMAAMGYPVFAIKLAAFVGAAAVAGLAGAMLAVNNAFVSPSLMHWTESATLLVMVVLGGLGRRWGAPLGVAVWMTLAEVLKLHTAYWHWPMGVVLLLVVFFAPRGLAALADRRGAA